MDTTLTAPISLAKKALKRGGRILIVNGDLGDLVKAPFTVGAKVVAGPAKEDPAYLAQLAKLAETGAFRPHIEKAYAFDRIVDAHRHVDSGRKKGSVVVRMAET